MALVVVVVLLVSAGVGPWRVVVAVLVVEVMVVLDGAVAPLELGLVVALVVEVVVVVRWCGGGSSVYVRCVLLLWAVVCV